MAFRRNSEFTWKPIYRIAEDSVSSINTTPGGGGTPPATNNFLLSDGTAFLLSDGTNFLLS